jgi:hypothetical protein
VKAFLEKGGILAWGIVPTSQAVQKESVESLEARLMNLVEQLSAQGMDKQQILDQSMLTPSCGTGTLKKADADKVIELLCGLARKMQNQIRD